MNIDNPEINDNQIVTEQAQIANMWENNNNNLENDDFDSDQLDEDESYSWASGITDNQDLAQNGGGGGGSTLIGCSGGSGGTGGCSSSAANWRDWRSNNISNELLDNLAVLNRIGSHFAMKLSNYNNSNNNNNSNSINGQVNSRLIINTNSPILSLVDLCSKYIAANLPFELVESFKQPVPEDLQLKITYASFPDNTENIRLYSCLANGCVDEYLRGEQLYHNRCVRKIMQIGFHLSAQVIISSPLGINGNNSSLNSAINNNTVNNSNNSTVFLHNNYRTINNMPNLVGNGASSLFASVAIVCDRKRIISCHCTCSKQSIPWCSHIVAVCLFRILDPNNVEYRAPVSESLSKLHRDQLQKFAQYLISELPQQILPTAQRLLDELLKGEDSSMNLLSGAPDPTAGASQNDISVWCLDEVILQENIHKTLLKFIVPTPNVVSDIECLEHASSATAAEYTSLLRPLRGREPEGMWNLVSIVREMFKRRDKNSIPLLKLITYECVSLDQILQLWFLVKASQLSHDKVLFNSVSLNAGSSQRNNTNNNLTHTPPVYQACASLMDEIVTLWRIACLNPFLINIDDEKLNYSDQLLKWHHLTLEKLRKFCNSIINNNNNNNIWSSHTNTNSNNGEKLLKRLDMDQFSGFMPAINACRVTWNDFDFETTSFFKQQCLKQLEVISLVTNTSVINANNELKQQQQQQQLSNESNLTKILPINDSNTEKDPLSIYSFEYEPLKMKQKSEQANEKNSLINFKLKMFNNSNYNNIILSNINEDNIEIMFSRCEALYLHGFDDHACILAELLAEYLINTTTNIPSLFNQNEKNNEINETLIDQDQQLLTKKSSKNQNSKQKFVNNFYETILWRSYLTCNILYESSLRISISSAQNNKLTNRKKKSLNNLAFRIGLFGLETPRMPAMSKALEVKLINQEQDLVNLLKRLKIGTYELNLLVDRATKLKENGIIYNQTQRDYYPNSYQFLPVMLASFIFDIFSSNQFSQENKSEQTNNENENENNIKNIDYQMLSFEAAVAVLGMKANVSESQHSLLCEGIRRQKGDLALTLLLTYKDDEQRLLKIMDKILDRDVYILFKNNSSVILNPFNPNFKKIQQQQQQDFIQIGLNESSSSSSSSSSVIQTSSLLTSNESSNGSNFKQPHDEKEEIKKSQLAFELSQFQIKLLNSPSKLLLNTQSSNNLKTNTSAAAAAIDSLSSGWEESENESPNLSNNISLLETKYRCMNLKQQLQPQSQLIKDTTSSDNSPTNNRKQLLINKANNRLENNNSESKASSLASNTTVKKACSTIDDSGDDSGESSSSSQDNNKQHINTNDLDSKIDQESTTDLKSNSENNIKSNNSRHSNSNTRQPNQPSEALAHFMFEFSKTVLSKAGGSISSSVFLNQQNNQPGGGPHRNLHICSFLISLYALGLHNCVQPTWLTRTYSSHVTWINSQAADIGYAAICILIECWQGRLTPSECVALADRVSRGRDNMAIKAAAELALSGLKFANFMNLTEIQRALIQCKEQSNEMLQRACVIVENSVRDANSTNLLEILFTVAKRWDELFTEAVKSASNNKTASNKPVQSETIIETLNTIVQQQNNNNPYLNQQNNLNLSTNNQQASNFYPIYMQQSNMSQNNSYNNYNNNNNNNNTNNNANFFTQYNSNNFQQQQPNNNFNPNIFYNNNNNNNNNYQFNNHIMSFQQQQINYQQNFIKQHSTNIPTISVLETIDEASMKYLTSAFRVGMLGLEALPRRADGQIKYRQSPLYADDVKWLWEVSIKLGNLML
jgi:hypothetical protein